MSSSTLHRTLFPLACVTTSLVVIVTIVAGVRDLLPGTQSAIAQSEQLTADSGPTPAAANPPTGDPAEVKPETMQTERPDHQASTEPTLIKPSQANRGTDKMDKAVQPAYLQVQSSPPGARVEVGLQYSGWSITPRSGQKTCIAPCVVKLDPADVAMLPNGNANLMISLEKNGFASHTDVLELGKLDRSEALTPGKTYDRSITLQPSMRTQTALSENYSTWNLDVDP